MDCPYCGEIVRGGDYCPTCGEFVIDLARQGGSKGIYPWIFFGADGKVHRIENEEEERAYFEELAKRQKPKRKREWWEDEMDGPLDTGEWG